MKRNFSFKELFKLFITFFKIGLTTFGGGYAMIPIIENETVNKRKWIGREDIFDIITIGESTPGPISINAATFIGYKVSGFWGSFFSTLGIILPSFGIIFLISFFYKDFMSINIINAAFQGLKIGVVILLFRAALTLAKGLKRNAITLLAFCVALAIMLCATFLNWNIDINGFKLSISLLLILVSLVFAFVVAKVVKEDK